MLSCLQYERLQQENLRGHCSQNHPATLINPLVHRGGFYLNYQVRLDGTPAKAYNTTHAG